MMLKYFYNLALLSLYEACSVSVIWGSLTMILELYFHDKKIIKTKVLMHFLFWLILKYTEWIQ